MTENGFIFAFQSSLVLSSRAKAKPSEATGWKFLTPEESQFSLFFWQTQGFSSALAARGFSLAMGSCCLFIGYQPAKTQPPKKNNRKHLHSKHTCMIEACFYVNAVSWAISGMMHNGKAKSQSTVWFTRTPWFTWDNLETASTCRCNRLVRFTKQVHRADQALLPARVDSFVGCSLHCALHPPAMMLELVALFSLWNRGGHTHMASKAKLEPQKNIPRKKTQQKQPTTQKRKRKKEPRKRTPYVWPRPQKTGGP